MIEDKSRLYAEKILKEIVSQIPTRPMKQQQQQQQQQKQQQQKLHTPEANKMFDENTSQTTSILLPPPPASETTSTLVPVISTEFFSESAWSAFSGNMTNIWLFVVFQQCPFPATVRMFSRLLITCIKILRPIKPTISLSGEHHEPTSPKISRRPNQSVSHTEIIKELLDALLHLTQSSDVRFSMGKEAFRILNYLLNQVAALGRDYVDLLLSVGSIHRLVSAMLTINPSVNRIPLDELSACIDLISLLVRSAVIRSNIISDTAMPPQIPTQWSPFMTSQSDFVLSPQDLGAFINRIFLEDAISTGATNICSAIQHVCWSLDHKEASKILVFLCEKITDSGMSPTGVNLAYRPFFRILSELLLSQAVDINLPFETVIPQLLQKADFLVCRQYINDSELVYSILKLLHRIGSASKTGHSCVMRIKHLWAPLHAKSEVYKTTNKRKAQKTNSAESITQNINAFNVLQ